MRTAISVVPFFVFMAIAPFCFSQQENWYVLQLMHPLSDVQIKTTISAIINSSAGTEVWYNGAKSNTFGCKSSAVVSWPQIINELMIHDVFIADITLGNMHQTGNGARSSYFFALACYYAGHADQIPVGWIAQLNHDEWDGLPAEVREYYLANGLFEIVEK